jgi:serine/threonine protein phosphatase PrpC
MSETASLHPSNLSAPLPSYGESVKTIHEVVEGVAEDQAKASADEATMLVYNNPDLFNALSQENLNLTPEQSQQREAQDRTYEDRPEVLDGADAIAAAEAHMHAVTAEDNAAIDRAESQKARARSFGLRQEVTVNSEVIHLARQRINHAERRMEHTVRDIQDEIKDQARQRVHGMFDGANDNLSDFWREGDAPAYKYPKDIVVSVVAPRPTTEPVVEPAAKSSAEPTARIPRHLQKRAAKARAAALKGPEPAEEAPKAPEPEAVRPAPGAADVPTELERIEQDLYNAKRLGDVDGVAKLTLKYQNYREDNNSVLLPDTRGILDTSEPEQISPDDPEAPSFRMTLEARKGALGIVESDVDEPALRVGYEHDNSAHNQDALLVDEELGLFAVMDGVSSEANSKIVADATGRLLRDNVEMFFRDPQTREQAYRQMIQAFEKTANEVAGLSLPAGGAGITTVTAIKFFDLPGSNVRHAVLAHAGDSSAFVQDPYNKMLRVSQDQNTDTPRGPLLSNGFGPEVGGGSYNEQYGFKNQYAVFEVPEGSRIVLATDGITGDERFPGSHMTITEMEQYIAGLSAEQAVASLMAGSKKHDDKTCIVIDVVGSVATDDPRDGWRPIAPQVPPMVGDIEMEPIEQRTRVLGDVQPVTPEPVQQRTADETKVATGGLMSRVKRAVSPVLGPLGLYADGTSDIKPSKDSPAPTPAPVTQAKNPDASERASRAKEAEQAATAEFYKIQDRVRLLEAEPEKLYAYTQVSEADRQAGITVSDFDKTVTSIREQMNNMAPDMQAGFETAIRILQNRVAEIVADIEARKRLESLQADAK